MPLHLIWNFHTQRSADCKNKQYHAQRSQFSCCFWATSQNIRNSDVSSVGRMIQCKIKRKHVWLELELTDINFFHFFVWKINTWMPVMHREVHEGGSLCTPWTCHAQKLHTRVMIFTKEKNVRLPKPWLLLLWLCWLHIRCPFFSHWRFFVPSLIFSFLTCEIEKKTEDEGWGREIVEILGSHKS